MRLSNYGYKVTKTPRVRKMALGKAVKANGYSRVTSAISSRKSREKANYKIKRYRADLNWLQRRHNKYY